MGMPLEPATASEARSALMTTTEDLIELSVVVPVYNEAGNIAVFLERVQPIVESIVSSHEIIFAVDPSSDGTEKLVAQAHDDDPRVKYVVFSRRFGQPTATFAGIELASGQAVGVMDVDLQDPPELLPEFIARWREGYDVVYAQRRRRTGETAVKRLVANLGYRLINRFGEVEIPRNTGDFRLLDRRVVDALLLFPETNGFLRGLTALVGFKQIAITFDRPARHSGTGNYNRFFGSLRIGLNGLVCFSSALLNLSTWFGFFAAAGSVLVAFGYLVAKLLGVNFPVGNPTIVILLLLLGGLQLVCLGIVGQYIGRIYDEVKRRPRYLIDRAAGLPAAEASRLRPRSAPPVSPVGRADDR
jgi:glycosyltransferase involved in cell wall biosynthesis